MPLAHLNLVKEVIRLAEEAKADSLSVMDLRTKEAPADFFVICTGQADVHVRAICDRIQEGLRQLPDKTKPLRLDGLDDGSWVVMDFFDVMVHVFLPDKRIRFALEKFWCDVPVVGPAELGSLEIKPTPRPPAAIKTRPRIIPARREKARAKAKGPARRKTAPRPSRPRKKSRSKG